MHIIKVCVPLLSSQPIPVTSIASLSSGTSLDKAAVAGCSCLCCLPGMYGTQAASLSVCKKSTGFDAAWTQPGRRAIWAKVPYAVCPEMICYCYAVSACTEAAAARYVSMRKFIEKKLFCMVAVNTGSLSREQTMMLDMDLIIMEGFVLASADSEIRLTRREGTHTTSFSVTLPELLKYA